MKDLKERKIKEFEEKFPNLIRVQSKEYPEWNGSDNPNKELKSFIIQTIDETALALHSKLNESIPEIVRDLTAVPTQGLEKSRARRILEDKLNELI